MSIKNTLFLLLLGFNSVLIAQTLSILDNTTSQPISGVLVSDETQVKSAQTDEKGKMELDLFTHLNFLLIQHPDYKNIRIAIEEIKKQDYQIYLTSKWEGLSEVIISTSKFKQRKIEVPHKVLTLTAKDVQFQNPQTTADLLGNSQSIFIQKSQLGGGSPIIRGFSANRLLITVDGVRMNNAIFRGGNLQNVISIDPFALERTEVTLGAGSVVYGSDALGGVMSFYNKKASPSFTDERYTDLHASVRYASANQEKTTHLDFNLGYKKWGFLSSISFSDFDDLKMGRHGSDEYLRDFIVQRINNEDVVVPNNKPRVQSPTGYNQVNFMQKIAYEPKENLTFDLGLHYSSTSDFPRYDRLIRVRDNGVPNSAEWFYGPQVWMMGHFNVTKLSSSSNLYDKIQSTVAYQYFKESRHRRGFQSSILAENKEKLNAYSFNLDLEKSFSDTYNFFYGAEYVFNKVGSQGNEYHIDNNTHQNAVSRYPNGATWQSFAAYTNLKYTSFKKFIIQAGVRYSHIVSTSNFKENNTFLNLPFDQAKLNTGALTGSLGFNWNPSTIIQWKLLFSSAFRAPNIDDIGKLFDSEPRAVVVPNNDLKPESAFSGELGLRLNFNGVLKLDMNTYYTHLEDALIRRDFTLDGESEIIYNGELSRVQAIQNASKANIYGFEVGAIVKLNTKWTWSSSFNVIGGKEELDGEKSPVRHIAPNFGKSVLTYKNKKLKVNLRFNYNAELPFNRLANSERSKEYLYATDSNGNPYAPSWHTWNLQSSYKINNSLSMSLALENISDQRYRTYSSGISAAGRNLILALNYKL